MISRRNLLSSILLASALIGCGPKHSLTPPSADGYDILWTGGNLPVVEPGSNGESGPAFMTPDDPRINQARSQMVADPLRPNAAEQQNLNLAGSIKSIRFRGTDAIRGGNTVLTDPSHFDYQLLVEVMPGQVFEVGFRGQLMRSGAGRTIARTVSTNDGSVARLNRSYSITGTCADRNCRGEINIRLARLCFSTNQRSRRQWSECGVVNLFGSRFQSRITPRLGTGFRNKNAIVANRDIPAANFEAGFSQRAQDSVSTLWSGIDFSSEVSRWSVPYGISLLDFYILRKSDRAPICSISAPSVPTNNTEVEATVASDCQLQVNQAMLFGHSGDGNHHSLRLVMESQGDRRLGVSLDYAATNDPGNTAITASELSSDLSLSSSQEYMHPYGLNYHYWAPAIHGRQSRTEAPPYRAPVVRTNDQGYLNYSRKIDDDMRRNLRDRRIYDRVQAKLRIPAHQEKLRHFFENAAPVRALISGIFNGVGVSPAFFYLYYRETNFFTTESSRRSRLGGNEPLFVSNISPTGEGSTTACGPGQIVEGTAHLMGMFINTEYGTGAGVCSAQTDDPTSVDPRNNIDERIFLAPALCGTARYLRHLSDTYLSGPQDDLTLAIGSYHDGDVLSLNYSAHQRTGRRCAQRGGRGDACTAWSRAEIQDVQVGEELIRDYGYSYAQLARLNFYGANGHPYIEEILMVYYASLRSQNIGKESWMDGRSEVVPPFIFPPSNWPSTNMGVCNSIMGDRRFIDSNVIRTLRAASEDTARRRELTVPMNPAMARGFR